MKQAVASPLLETTIAGASHVIINVSGDITLMDASDAAEYVQELAGEDANIIFGAMYDDSKADEATITVIATGLHNVGGTSSKLKSRLEGVQQRASMIPPASSYDRQVHGSKLNLGAAPTAGGGTTQTPRRTAGGTIPTLDTPRTPTAKVKEQTIKIPDFFKK